MRCFRYRRKYTKQSRLNHILYKEQSSIQNISNIQTFWKYINMITLKYLRIHTKYQLTLTISSQTPRYTEVAYQKEGQEKKVKQRLLAFLASIRGQIYRIFWQHTLLCQNHLYPSVSWFGHPMMSNLSCYGKFPYPPSCQDMDPHDCTFPYAS